MQVRIPKKLLSQFRKLAADNKRSVTKEAEIAFENHLKTVTKATAGQTT